MFLLLSHFLSSLPLSFSLSSSPPPLSDSLALSLSLIGYCRNTLNLLGKPIAKTLCSMVKRGWISTGNVQNDLNAVARKEFFASLESFAKHNEFTEVSSPSSCHFPSLRDHVANGRTVDCQKLIGVTLCCELIEVIKEANLIEMNISLHYHHRVKLDFEVLFSLLFFSFFFFIIIVSTIDTVLRTILLSHLTSQHTYLQQFWLMGMQILRIAQSNPTQDVMETLVPAGLRLVYGILTWPFGPSPSLPLLPFLQLTHRGCGSE